MQSSRGEGLEEAYVEHGKKCAKTRYWQVPLAYPY